MACSINKRTLLGFADEYMTSDRDEYYTNKIGGSPDWVNPSEVDISNPACDICTSELTLVSQIYAPLSVSEAQHRTLYLFACLQPPCWNRPDSWTCLRSQRPQQSPQRGGEEKNTSTEKKATDWLGEADDWGDDNEMEDPNGNFGIEYKAVVKDDPQHNNVIVPLNKLTLSCPMASTQGGEASAGVGETAEAAVAEIEMDGEDLTVAVEAPHLSISNTNIPGLFTVANRSVPMSGVKLEPFYIWVQEEGEQEETQEHELSLLTEYKAREALQQIEAGGGKRDKKTPAGADQYEKSLPSHGDEYFHNFISVMKKHPAQILRYDRLSGSGPLLLCPLPSGQGDTRCQYCGGLITFEFQLLPSLVSSLSAPGLESPPLEFGTVLVFTCSRSCWSQGSGPRRETLVVQAETM